MWSRTNTTEREKTLKTEEVPNGASNEQLSKKKVIRLKTFT